VPLVGHVCLCPLPVPFLLHLFETFAVDDLDFEPLEDLEVVDLQEHAFAHADAGHEQGRLLDVLNEDEFTLG
jgi:hypothetical protein